MALLFYCIFYSLASSISRTTRSTELTPYLARAFTTPSYAPLSQCDIHTIALIDRPKAH